MNLRRIAGVFSRVTTSGFFLPNIDGLRFIAIALVVLYHSWAEIARSTTLSLPRVPLASVISVGWVGVTLFFAISGFVLALPFANHYINGAKPVRLRQYFLRRLTRLEPPYIICLLVYFLIKSLVLKQQGLLPHFLASITYTHNCIYNQVSLINGVAWSLEIEVQFYILAPLMAQLFRIRRPLVRRAVVVSIMLVLGVLTDLYLAPQGTTHNLYLLPHLNYFLTGFLLADVFATEMAMGQRNSRSFLWDIPATAAWVLMFVVLHKYKVDALFFPALIWVAYMGTLRGVLWNAFTSNPFIYTVGGMCYTIYLCHNLMLEFFIRSFHLADRLYALTGASAFWMCYLPLISLCVLCCCGPAFALFEKPFMLKNWPQKLRGWVASFRPGSVQRAEGR